MRADPFKVNKADQGDGPRDCRRAQAGQLEAGQRRPRSAGGAAAVLALIDGQQAKAKQHQEERSKSSLSGQEAQAQKIKQ